MLPPVKDTWMFWGQYQQRTLPWLLCMLSHKSSSVSCCWQQGRTSAAESILVAAWVTGARRRGWQESGMEKLWVAASHTGDEPGTMEEPWTRLWRLVAPVQRRGRLRWGSREAALWLCGSAGQAHVQPRTTGWEKCPQLMSTETWQLACKSFGLGPSVPCSYKTCCHGPSARLAGVLRQDKHPEQGAHTSPGITACLLRQSRENNYFSKEHCVITTLTIISS